MMQHGNTHNPDDVLTRWADQHPGAAVPTIHRVDPLATVAVVAVTRMTRPATRAGRSSWPRVTLDASDSPSPPYTHEIAATG